MVENLSGGKMVDFELLCVIMFVTVTTNNLHFHFLKMKHLQAFKVFQKAWNCVLLLSHEMALENQVKDPY